MLKEARPNQKWYHAVLIGVMIAVLAGGTAPWWWGELNKKTTHSVSNEASPQELSGSETTSPVQSGQDTTNGDEHCELDADGDGVPDCSDTCSGTSIGSLVNDVGCSVFTDDLGGVNFDMNSSELRPDAAAILSEVVDILNRYKGTKVQIRGYAAGMPSERENIKLSRERADRAYAYLLEHGVERQQLFSPLAFGSSEPRFNNEVPAANEKVTLDAY